MKKSLLAAAVMSLFLAACGGEQAPAAASAASEASARRVASDREKAAIEQQANEAEQEQRRQQDIVSRMEAPAKRQIGACLCIVRNGMGYAGYTEQLNEETGRIRIRVVRQFNPATGRFLLSSRRLSCKCCNCWSQRTTT